MKLLFLLLYLRWQSKCEEACKTFTSFHLTESFLSFTSLMLRRYITSSGPSSISARNTHLGSFEMSVYITFIWLHCSISHSGSSQLCPITCYLHLCLCLTLDRKWVFWNKHCDFSEVFGSILQQVRWGSFTVEGSLALLPGAAARAWTVGGWPVSWAPGQGTSQRAFMDWPSYASGWCVSAVAWSNPIKEGCFFFKNVYEKPLCFPADIQTIHRKGLVFYPFKRLSSDYLHGLLDFCLKW